MKEVKGGKQFSTNKSHRPKAKPHGASQNNTQMNDKPLKKSLTNTNKEKSANRKRPDPKEDEGNDRNPKKSKKSGPAIQPEMGQQEEGAVEQDDEDGVAITIDRVKQVNLNQKIAQHANRKELLQAFELYQQALQEDLANSHTFAAMVNAAVRCANMAMAEEVISTMLSKGRKLKDVVLYTTLMKGYCAQGNLTKALKLFQDMRKKAAVVQPNIRTINTLLRGCVQMGEIYIAEAIFQQMQKELAIKPDVSSWEYLITLLSQGLLVDKILPINGRIKSDATLQSGVISININLARAAALLGEYKLSSKCLQLVLTTLESSTADRQDLADDADVDGDVAADSCSNMQKTVMGGKRAWKSTGDSTLSIDDKRNQSLILYREHIREEWKQEAHILSQFLQDRQISGNKQSAFDFLYSFYFRILSFDSNLVYATNDSTGSIFTSVGVQNEINVEDVRNQIFNALCYKFGLDALVHKASNHHISELLALQTGESGAESSSSKNHGKKNNSGKKNSNVSLADMINFPPIQNGGQMKVVNKDTSGKFIDAVHSLKLTVNSYFDSNGFLNFPKIFPTLMSDESNSDQSVHKPRLVKLEICSGAGEWAVSQAKNDQLSPWLTLELRHDRVYQTFTKTIYSKLNNLCVMGGDAMLVLPRHVSDGCVGNIFVNHPEPPQQTGGDNSEGHHLLNEAFFLQAERILAENGMCTIVTDNSWYGKFLCRLLSTHSTLRMRSLTSKDSTLINPSWSIHHEVDNFVLWVGEPGKEAGHIVDASSYFDRLWKRGQLQERYFLILVKSSNYIRPRPTSKAPLKIPSISTKSKSIKFSDDA